MKLLTSVVLNAFKTYTKSITREVVCAELDVNLLSTMRNHVGLSNLATVM